MVSEATESDVRGIRGRLARLVIAVVVGVKGLLPLALLLPTREHSTLQGADPTLMVVGGVVLALATYAAIGAIAAHLSRRRVKRLPRAMLVQRRRRTGEGTQLFVG